MGKKDITLKSYLSDTRRYADLWNGCMFQGRQIIEPASLTAVNTVFDKADEQPVIERIADLSMKQAADGSFYVLWMVENQTYVDYSMPVRVMLQEALAYDRQVKEIRKKNSVRTDCGAAHCTRNFLSGMRAEDLLNPVVTLVVYWGDETWQGGRSLHDIMNFGKDKELADALKELIPRYPIHFVNLSEMRNCEHFQTELKTLFELFGRRQDKTAFMEYLQSHEECRNIDRETSQVLRILIRSEELDHYGKRETGEKLDMCRAITELIADGKEAGRVEGKAEGRMEGKAEGIAEGLQALTVTLKGMLPDFNAVYQAVIRNDIYRDVPREQVRKYYEVP
ncbi:MAG: Rpn family recombination-promoting nuclease/putative transposase [Lachnospiraceae bacterium]|nr:Rpn family recombination-promoting nuclease/putative transposase [Lachnospiraceae bacterium]